MTFKKLWDSLGTQCWVRDQVKKLHSIPASLYLILSWFLNHWQVVKISLPTLKSKNSTLPILTEISHFLNYHDGKCFHMEAILTLKAPTETWVKAEAVNVGHSLTLAVLLQTCHSFACNWQSQMSCHVTWDATLKLGTQVSHFPPGRDIFPKSFWRGGNMVYSRQVLWAMFLSSVNDQSTSLNKLTSKTLLTWRYPGEAIRNLY